MSRATSHWDRDRALIWRVPMALICALGFGVLPAPPATADERAPVAEQMLAEMRQIATTSTIDASAAQTTVVCIEPAILRYSDPSRSFSDATLWLWTISDRPAALLKIEAMQHWRTGQPQWGLCIASIASQPLRVTMKDVVPIDLGEISDRRFALDDTGIPVTTTAGRRLQVRSVSRRLTATMVEAVTGDRQQMRRLPRPLYEFHDSKTEMLSGVLVGWTSNGTNPDLIVSLLVDEVDDGWQQWRACPIRMTNGGLTLRFDEVQLWNCEPIRAEAAQQQTWAFFQIPRQTSFEKEGE